MSAPRLVQVNCPQCGAGLRFNPEDEVVTCRYCGLSSSVESLTHLARPAPEAGLAELPQRSGNPAVLLVVALAGTLLIAGIGAVVFLAGGSTSISRPAPLAPPPSFAPSMACDKAVVCCKAVMMAGAVDPATLRSCEAMRAMSDADCLSQYKTLRESAHSLGRSCD